eukprot:551276-Pelagomonas_calceolata.AAC.1
MKCKCQGYSGKMCSSPCERMLRNTRTKEQGMPIVLETMYARAKAKSELSGCEHVDKSTLRFSPEHEGFTRGLQWWPTARDSG